MGDWVIFFGKNLFSMPNLLRSKVTAIFGSVCTAVYKPVNSMHDFRSCFILPVFKLPHP